MPIDRPAGGRLWSGLVAERALWGDLGLAKCFRRALLRRCPLEETTCDLVCLLDDCVSAYERGAAEATDGMIPQGWKGNPWGPAAAVARRTGKLPPVPMTKTMLQWDGWGRKVLRDGDIVFRLGDARTMLGFLPLSRFIAHAKWKSAFSHTGIVAIEDGARFLCTIVRRPGCNASRSRSGCWIPSGRSG